MFTDSRSIDDRATAASFDTALQKYAASTDSWFDGTPFSIDARLAQCRRLMHIARQRTARRGADAGPLTNLAALEADSRALVALRHDLLTGAYDREDNSPIAGVRVAAGHLREEHDGLAPWEAADAEKGFDKDASSDEGWQSMNGLTVEELIHLLKAEMNHTIEEAHGESPYGSHHHANCGDDEEFAGGEHDEQPNDYLFDEMGRYHRDRFKGEGKESRRIASDGAKSSDAYEESDEYEEEWLRKNAPEGQEEWDRRKANLSPQDRRYVTLESSRFLADNTDTNDARELATRAAHYAEKVTSSYDQDRSRIVTAAFVMRVASGATRRGYLSRAVSPVGVQKTANIDSLPPEALFF